MLPNIRQGFGVGRRFWNILTLILLTWRIWRTPNNASEWKMVFNSAFEGLKMEIGTSLILGTKRNPCSLDSLKKCVRLGGI
jgi:hypothetical protein